MVKAQTAEVARELKHAQRKRQRLRDKAKNLSTADIQDVLEYREMVAQKMSGRKKHVRREGTSADATAEAADGEEVAPDGAADSA